jgi:hypothetical protein
VKPCIWLPALCVNLGKICVCVVGDLVLLADKRTTWWPTSPASWHHHEVRPNRQPLLQKPALTPLGRAGPLESVEGHVLNLQPWPPSWPRCQVIRFLRWTTNADALHGRPNEATLPCIPLHLCSKHPISVDTKQKVSYIHFNCFSVL